MSIIAAIGNVASDPHISKNDKNEPTYARFTLVEDEYVSGGKRIKTYIDCVGFGRMAGIIAQLLKKGTLCYIEGGMVSGQYDKNGSTIYTRNVRVDRLRVFDKVVEAGVSTERENDSSDQEKLFDDDISWDS